MGRNAREEKREEEKKDLIKREKEQEKKYGKWAEEQEGKKEKNRKEKRARLITWNCGTIKGGKDKKGGEELVKSLKFRDIDLAGVQETRAEEEGERNIGDYKFIGTKGKRDINGNPYSGVGLFVRRGIEVEAYEGNHFLLMVKIKNYMCQNLMLIVYYGGQEETEEAMKRFEELDKKIEEYKEMEKEEEEYEYLILGDMNAKLGKDNNREEGEEVGAELYAEHTSPNGMRLYEILQGKSLTALNTRRKDRINYTCKTNTEKGEVKTQIDYIIAEQEKSRMFGKVKVVDWKPMEKKNLSGHMVVLAERGLKERLIRKKNINPNDGKKPVNYDKVDMGKFIVRRERKKREIKKKEEREREGDLELIEEREGKTKQEMRREYESMVVKQLRKKEEIREEEIGKIKRRIEKKYKEEDRKERILEKKKGEKEAKKEKARDKTEETNERRKLKQKWKKEEEERQIREEEKRKETLKTRIMKNCERAREMRDRKEGNWEKILKKKTRNMERELEKEEESRKKQLEEYKEKLKEWYEILNKEIKDKNLKRVDKKKFHDDIREENEKRDKYIKEGEEEYEKKWEEFKKKNENWVFYKPEGAMKRYRKRRNNIERLVKKMRKKDTFEENLNKREKWEEEERERKKEVYFNENTGKEEITWEEDNKEKERRRRVEKEKEEEEEFEEAIKYWDEEKKDNKELYEKIIKIEKGIKKNKKKDLRGILIDAKGELGEEKLEEMKERFEEGKLEDWGEITEFTTEWMRLIFPKMPEKKKSLVEGRNEHRNGRNME